MERSLLQGAFLSRGPLFIGDSRWCAPGNLVKWCFCMIRDKDRRWPADILSVQGLPAMVGVGELKVELVGDDDGCCDGRLL